MQDPDDPGATLPSRESAQIAKASAGLTAELPYDERTILGKVEHYDLLQEIGRGGMGVIYRAFSRRLPEPVNGNGTHAGKNY
ncbi:MAG: hypothetical protein GY772_05600 [bacterium]|nr:hypothetical protein [bacterium]